MMTLSIIIFKAMLFITLPFIAANYLIGAVIWGIRYAIADLISQSKEIKHQTSLDKARHTENRELARH